MVMVPFSWNWLGFEVRDAMCEALNGGMFRSPHGFLSFFGAPPEI